MLFFVSPFIYLGESRVLGAQTLWSHCSGPLCSPLRFGGRVLCAAVIWNKLDKWSSSGVRRNSPRLCASPVEKRSTVDEETLTSSYQRTEQRGFDPSPEPLLNRLAELPDDGEWYAVVGPQTVGLRLFPCHFLWTVWVNTLTLVSPVCVDIWLSRTKDLWNAFTGATTARVSLGFLFQTRCS